MRIIITLTFLSLASCGNSANRLIGLKGRAVTCYSGDTAVYHSDNAYADLSATNRRIEDVATGEVIYTNLGCVIKEL